MSKRTRTRIERHLPPVGTLLEAQFKGKKYKAEIVKNSSFPDGKAISFNNVLYRSMTAAANVVTKQSTNGWRFWKMSSK